MDIFGIKRSVQPAYSLPQQAWRIDNSMDPRPDELLIDVSIISVNLVSFNEIWEEAGDNDRMLCHRVMEIIRERGKLHNPVTNTGGMLYGRVRKIGEKYPNRYGLSVGDEVISLTSLSVTPLQIRRILSVDYSCAQLTVEGSAILFASSPVIKRARDIPLEVVIAAMDEAGVSACTYHLVEKGQSVLVMGAGGRSGLLCGYAARDKLGDSGCLVGIVRSEAHRQQLEKYGVYDRIYVMDATEFKYFCIDRDNNVSEKFDLVINCINSVNTEIFALMAVKPRGSIYFATLVCDYKFTGLTAESIGKQVRIIPYAGFIEGHAEYTLDLLRRFPRMQEAIQSLFGDANCHHVQVEQEEQAKASNSTSVTNANGYIFRSSQSKITLNQALKVSRYTSNVMIYGESGVGKEIVARIIHQNSERKSFPMVKINCAAIPENLLESELFGYEKGAFTGANAKGKIGLWEAAQNGSLFLDEVGELPLSFQAKLLRVIQEKEIVRVGGVSPIKVDVRIIAATNRDLADMVRRGLFREDLYYRLNVYPITVLPLRQRRQDIAPLAQHFVERYNREFALNKQMPQNVLEFLEGLPFRGNIRELQNLIQRLMITAEHQTIEVRDVLTAMSYDRNGGAPVPQTEIKDETVPGSEEQGTLKEILARREESVLRVCKEKYGSTRKIARLLGISQSTAVRKLNFYGIGEKETEE